MAKALFVSLEKNRFLAYMVLNDRVIRESQGGNRVSSEPFSGHTMEEFRVAITELEVPNRASFHPVDFFVVQQGQQMLFKNESEVHFRNS